MNDHLATSKNAIELAKRHYPELMAGFQAGNDDLFMQETSAPDVMDDILDFGVELGSERPVVVEVAPSASARPGWCFDNVRRMVETQGGKPVLGWAIWSAPAMWHNAEFHVVYETPSGNLIDVTPKVDGETHIIFAATPEYGADFDFYRRPNNRRMRVYGHAERKPGVAAKIASLSDRRLAYEREEAFSKGLTLSQSIGMELRGRDLMEKLIDTFLEDVGRLEAMTKPTPEGIFLKDPRRRARFDRLAADVLRQRNKLYLMADMQVRGMVPK